MRHVIHNSPGQTEMAPVDTRAGFLALLGIVLRHLDPQHQESTAQQVIGAADDILRAAEQHTAQLDQDYHKTRGDDGMTQAERDAGWTPEQVAERQRQRMLPQLPAIAATPGNDQLAVLAALHADGDIIDELRAEAAANLSDEHAPGSLFAEIAEHYPGVANELRAYVTNPNIATAAQQAGGGRFLTVSDGGASETAAPGGGTFATEGERNAARQSELADLHASGQVTDRRVPGDYVPPDSARDTSGDAERIADDIARQQAGRQAFNASQGGAVETPNGELPELESAPALGTDDAGKIQEIGGGAIQQDDAPGSIQQDDAPGTIQQDTSGGKLQEPLSEQDGGQIQGADQGAGNAPQQ